MRSLQQNFDEFNVYLNNVELKPYLIRIANNWPSGKNSCEIYVKSLCERTLMLPSGKETNNKILQIISVAVQLKNPNH